MLGWLGAVREGKETNAREDFHNFLNLADDMVGRGQRTWQARFVFQESLTNLSRDCSTEARPGDEAKELEREEVRREGLDGLDGLDGPAVRPTSASNNDSRNTRCRIRLVPPCTNPTPLP